MSFVNISLPVLYGFLNHYLCFILNSFHHQSEVTDRLKVRNISYSRVSRTCTCRMKHDNLGESSDCFWLPHLRLPKGVGIAMHGLISSSNWTARLQLNAVSTTHLPQVLDFPVLEMLFFLYRRELESAANCRGIHLLSLCPCESGPSTVLTDNFCSALCDALMFKHKHHQHSCSGSLSTHSLHLPPWGKEMQVCTWKYFFWKKLSLYLEGICHRSPVLKRVIRHIALPELMVFQVLKISIDTWFPPKS